MEDAAVRAVPCALEGARLPCVGVAFTGHPRPLPKTKHLPRYCSVRCRPSVRWPSLSVDAAMPTGARKKSCRAARRGGHVIVTVLLLELNRDVTESRLGAKIVVSY